MRAYDDAMSGPSDSMLRMALPAGRWVSVRRAVPVTVLALLPGCAVVSPDRGPPSRAPSSAPAAAEQAAEVERRWLQSWFDGTPVAIRRDADELGIDVPREFCFAGSGTAIQPALAAVLDKVAESLRRRPQAGLQVLGAPGGAPALVQRRAERVVLHLRSRGVAAARLARADATETTGVRLRLSFAAP